VDRGLKVVARRATTWWGWRRAPRGGERLERVRDVAPTAQGEEALAEGGALQANEAATAPEVNNSEAASKSESESESDSEAEPGTGDVKQDAVAELYDYRKARVTPLDWPAYKWPSIPELVEAQQASDLGRQRRARRRPRTGAGQSAQVR
jgi:hypothetical protein